MILHNLNINQLKNIYYYSFYVIMVFFKMKTIIMKKFVCIWELSGFYTDSDGEDWNTSNFHGYTFHDSFEEALNISKEGCEAFARIKELPRDEDRDYWAPIFVSEIAEYQNNELTGLHNLGSYEPRFYPVLDHWKDMYPHLMTFPPVEIEENNFD